MKTEIVGTFTFTVEVNQKPVLTSMTTDGTVSSDGSGYRPYQGSATRHIYVNAGNDYYSRQHLTHRKILNGSDTELTEGTANTYSIDTSNPAEVIITWGTSIPITGNDYTIVVTETNSTTGCYAESELTVTILENTFNATVERSR